jgi:hypothetical protein
MNRLARAFLRPRVAALGILALGSVALASPAHAWWRGGVVVGVAPPPFYFGPPVYYPPPPVVYAPPPVVYAPPGPAYGAPGVYSPPPGFAQSCYAGPYMCPLTQSFPAGSACSCPDNYGRRVYGQAR